MLEFALNDLVWIWQCLEKASGSDVLLYACDQTWKPLTLLEDWWNFHGYICEMYNNILYCVAEHDNARGLTCEFDILLCLLCILVCFQAPNDIAYELAESALWETLRIRRDLWIKQSGCWSRRSTLTRYPSHSIQYYNIKSHKTWPIFCCVLCCVCMWCVLWSSVWLSCLLCLGSGFSWSRDKLTGFSVCHRAMGNDNNNNNTTNTV